MKYKIHLALAGCDIDVRVQPDVPALLGKAVTTIREDGVSVAMTQENQPVFVRIRGAQRHDPFFATLINRVPALSSGLEVLTLEESNKIIAFATQKMRDAVSLYNKRQIENSWSSPEPNAASELEVCVA